MQVMVHLGEPYWRVAGQHQTWVALLPSATVANALRILTTRYPALAAEFDNVEAKPALFVNNEVACPESPLFEGATLHVVWPVSGG